MKEKELIWNIDNLIQLSSYSNCEDIMYGIIHLNIFIKENNLEKKFNTELLKCVERNWGSEEETNISDYAEAFLDMLRKMEIYFPNIEKRRVNLYSSNEILKSENTETEKKLKVFNREIIEEILYTMWSEKNYIKVPIKKLNALLENTPLEVLYDVMYANPLKIFWRINTFEKATSDNLYKIVIDLLDIKDNDIVFDMCSGVGNFLTNVSNKNKKCKLFGIDINKTVNLIAKIRLSFLKNDYLIEEANCLTSSNTSKYNKIFSSIPLGIRLDKEEKKYIMNNPANFYPINNNIGLSIEWMFVNRILSNLEKDGKAVVLMPSGPLFKVIDNDFKEKLIEDNYLEKVIRLPKAYFAPYTGIDFNLLIINKNKVNFNIEFLDLYNEENELDNTLEKINSNVQLPNISRIVNKEEIIKKNFNLTVDKYVGVKEVKYFNPKKLEEMVFDSFRGIIISAAEQEKMKDENGEYEILLISDIEDGNISNNLLRIDPKGKAVNRYLIQDGDVIVSSKGTKFKVAVAKVDANRKIIASGNLIVLRLNKKIINPYYLAMYLSSNIGNEILKLVQTGAVILSLNPGSLLKINVSMLELEEQEKYVKKYQEKSKEILAEKEKIKKMQNDLYNYFDDEILKRICGGK